MLIPPTIAFFAEAEGRTSMVDVLDFRSPLGLLGRMVDRLFLAAYLSRLLRSRATTIKHAAEQGGN